MAHLELATRLRRLPQTTEQMAWCTNELAAHTKQIAWCTNELAAYTSRDRVGLHYAQTLRSGKHIAGTTHWYSLQILHCSVKAATGAIVHGSFKKSRPSTEAPIRGGINQDKPLPHKCGAKPAEGADSTRHWYQLYGQTTHIKDFSLIFAKSHRCRLTPINMINNAYQLFLIDFCKKPPVSAQLTPINRPSSAPVRTRGLAPHLFESAPWWLNATRYLSPLRGASHFTRSHTLIIYSPPRPRTT